MDIKYKAVLFDLDGTLLNTTKGVVEAVKRTINNRGLSMPSEERLNEFVGPPMQLTMAAEYNMNERDSLAIANEFRENYRKYSLFQAELYDGVIDMMKVLRNRGMKIAVATNKSHQNAVSILKHFSIAPLCDYMQGSDLDGKLTKSDIINITLEALGIQKENAVYIGDSIIDLHGAEKANVDFIAVEYGFGFRPEDVITSSKCKMRVKNVKEIIECLD